MDAVLDSTDLSSELGGRDGGGWGFSEGREPAGPRGVGRGEHNRALCRYNLQSLIGDGRIRCDILDSPVFPG